MKKERIKVGDYVVAIKSVGGIQERSVGLVEEIIGNEKGNRENSQISVNVNELNDKEVEKLLSSMLSEGGVKGE